MTSAREAERIDILVRGSAKDTAARSSSGGQTKQSESKEYEALVEAMPWLEHLDKIEAFAHEVRRQLDKGDTSADADAAASTLVDEIDEEAVLSAISLLEAERTAEIEIAAVMETREFRVKHRAGDSTLLDTGTYYDACQGRSTTAGAEWAVRHGLQVTFKATFSVHNSGPAKVLCRAWCHRMQYFYNLEQASTEEVFMITEDMKAAYEEPAELLELERAPERPANLQRIKVLRSIP